MLKSFFFLIYRHSYVFYCDREQHFDNAKLKNFLKIRKIIIDYNLSKFSKNIEMIEIFNKILKNVLKKNNSNKK